MEAARLAIWFEETGKHMAKERKKQQEGSTPGMAPQFENSETVGIVGDEDEEWAFEDEEGD